MFLWNGENMYALIRITEKHINNGIPGSRTQCPINLAVNDVLKFGHYSVLDKEFSIRTLHKGFSRPVFVIRTEILPSYVPKFMHAFDTIRPMKREALMFQTKKVWEAYIRSRKPFEFRVYDLYYHRATKTLRKMFKKEVLHF